MKSGKLVAVKSALSKITRPRIYVVDKVDPIFIVEAEKTSGVFVAKFNIPHLIELLVQITNHLHLQLIHLTHR